MSFNSNSNHNSNNNNNNNSNNNNNNNNNNGISANTTDTVVTTTGGSGGGSSTSSGCVPHSQSAPHQLGVQPPPLTPLAQHHQALAQQLQQRFAITNNNVVSLEEPAVTNNFSFVYDSRPVAQTPGNSLFQTSLNSVQV
ncbi:hypothetical protein GQX74_012676 [Glossina fuscipes]|nr:hypothetical protein GQX74_012676 [Glossina fuscipes]